MCANEHEDLSDRAVWLADGRHVFGPLEEKLWARDIVEFVGFVVRSARGDPFRLDLHLEVPSVDESGIFRFAEIRSDVFFQNADDISGRAFKGLVIRKPFAEADPLGHDGLAERFVEQVLRLLWQIIFEDRVGRDKVVEVLKRGRQKRGRLLNPFPLDRQHRVAEVKAKSRLHWLSAEEVGILFLPINKCLRFPLLPFKLHLLHGIGVKSRCARSAGGGCLELGENRGFCAGLGLLLLLFDRFEFFENRIGVRSRDVLRARGGIYKQGKETDEEEETRVHTTATVPLPRGCVNHKCIAGEFELIHNLRMDYLARARRVIEIEIEEAASVARRLDEDFSRAIELIKSRVESRGKVVVVGVGKSGHIGEKIAATLTSTGSPAVVLNSLNALHGDLGVVSEGDVVIALSYSGETDELVAILPAFVRLGIPVIAITGGRDSVLAKCAAVVLDVTVSQEACPLNLAPTSSTTAMLVVGDALAMTLLEARGFRKEDFARFHPGGTLGRSLMLRVHQIMRGVEDLVILHSEGTVLEAVQGMTAKRAGAAVVVDESGRLLGIFTHGDFARHFPDHPTIGSLPVGTFMTRDPVTIPGDKLAAEVLQTLEHHRIDDLVVVDAGNRPIGIVDSQDLSRLKIL